MSAAPTSPPQEDKVFKDSVPKLPSSALVIAAVDEATWELECREYKALEEAPEAPRSFAPRLASFLLKGSHYHAFENVGAPLKELDFEAVLSRDDEPGAPLPIPVSDRLRLTLVKDLLDAVHWCHLQGEPHLALDNCAVRVFREEPPGPKRRGFWRLNVVGIGAGPQLITKTQVFQLGNESWPFNPPETLSGALLKGNLPGLYAWDAWSVGVLITMICGGYTDSPFDSQPELRSLTFSAQSAVAKRVRSNFADFSDFMSVLNSDGGGFLFRHGWLVEIIVGLLKQDPDQRMSVVAAWEIMTSSMTSSAKKASPNGSRSSSAASKGGKLTAGQLGILRDLFNDFDTDRSGDISDDEVVAALARMGTTISLDKANKMINEVDSNGDARIDFGEFVEMTEDLVSSRNGPVNLSASEVFGRRFSSNQGEPYRSLEAMISIADKGLCEVVIQDRDNDDAGVAGLKNYGEIVGFRNRADGDRWDIFAPGLDVQLPADSRHRLTAVFGVLLIKGGNHKLAVGLQNFKPDPARVKADVEKFIDDYADTHKNVASKRRIRYLELDDPYSRPAGSLEIDPSLLDIGSGSGEWLTKAFDGGSDDTASSSDGTTSPAQAPSSGQAEGEASKSE